MSVSRCIFIQKDIDLWRISPAYKYLMEFIEAVNSAVKGKLLSDPFEQTPVGPCRVLTLTFKTTKAVVTMLDAIDEITTKTPPIAQPSRFGNAAFRTWHAALVQV